MCMHRYLGTVCVQGSELGQGQCTVQSRRTAQHLIPTSVGHGGGEGGARDIGKHSTTTDIIITVYCELQCVCTRA